MSRRRVWEGKPDDLPTHPLVHERAKLLNGFIGRRFPGCDWVLWIQPKSGGAGPFFSTLERGDLIAYLRKVADALENGGMQ